MIALTDLTLLLSLALAVLLVTPFLGRYMAAVMEGERTFLSPVLRPVERAVYRVCGIDETSEQGWKGYAVALLLFSLVGILVMYAMLRLQDVLPLNPNASAAFSPELSFNTAISFETNTNWQNYSGEGASHLIQSAGLAVRNFTSAAAGIAIAVALIRGLVRRNASSIGNFWVDLTRATLYILLPLAVVGAIVLAWQGVTQTFDGTATATTLQGAEQTIARGPFASQEIIKELGTNGGGPLNANSAHPFENPTGADQLARDVRHPHHPLRPDLHVRPHGRRPAPGLGDLRGHGRRARRRRGRGHGRRDGRQPAVPGRRGPAPRQHGGQGAALRLGRRAASGPPSRPARAPGP